MESNDEKIEVEGSEKDVEDQKILEFLDSLDDYLCFFDSLSCKLRQGWLELASARHSMGALRMNSSLFDLKSHSAATTLQVKETHDEYPLAEEPTGQPHFTLSMWRSSVERKIDYSMERDVDEDVQEKSHSSQLRHRHQSSFSGFQEKKFQADEASINADDKAQKERTKLLSVFGTLVSPKLRSAQVSFETALETLIEIANMRSLVLSAYHQIKREKQGVK